jgi:peptidoglycan hydrolase CwlO-like protein
MHQTRSSMLLIRFFLLLASILLIAHTVHAETDDERRARLEKELEHVERQILQQQVLVEDKQVERQSLERDLNILDAQIKKAKLGIQARSVVIEQLDDQIDDKEGVIIELNERLSRQRQSLGQLLRKTQEIDDYTLIEILLSKENFSNFFNDFESFQSVKTSLNESLDLLKDIRTDTEDQKQSLEGKQLSEQEMKRIQETEKKSIESREQEKEKILTVTKGEEQAYIELLENQKKTAAQLRNQLFSLLGDSGQIPFPEAVSLAEYAGGKTGVSPALILAVVEQESNYGSNTGSCLVGDIRAGKSVMHPTRDAPLFIAIADILGFDPDTQKVSCPITGSNGVRIGWGGAMGPLQFIPSTWAMYGGIVSTGSGALYDEGKDIIRRLTGSGSASNPFNKQDAFMAAALLLRDNGANGTYAGDRLAALRYYAGWGGASRPENQFYGDGVMARKARLEGDIKTLEGG